MPQATISKWERDQQKPDSTHTVRIARMAGLTPAQFLGIPDLGEVEVRNHRVPLVGQLQAGAWREPVSYDEQSYVEAPLPDAFADLDVQAFEVAGPSMNRLYPEGTIVYAASPMRYREPQSEDRVIVVRTNKTGQVEVTLKEYVVAENGQKWLWPRSYDPEHQAPLQFRDGSGEDVVITGIVVGAFILEASRKVR